MFFKFKQTLLNARDCLFIMTLCVYVCVLLTIVLLYAAILLCSGAYLMSEIVAKTMKQQLTQKYSRAGSLCFVST
jgi:hypothetical protein